MTMSWRSLRLRRWRALAAVLLIVALALIVLQGRQARDEGAAPVLLADANAAGMAVALGVTLGATDAPPPAGQHAAQRRTLLEQLAQADARYCGYQAGSRYPPGSRPMAEHADQAAPNAPIAESKPMRIDGGGGGSGASDSAVRIETTQSRVYLAAGESVAMALRAVDTEGRVLPLVVTGALARGITYGDARPGPQVSVPFADAGAVGSADTSAGADPVTVAGDGRLAGVLAPAQTGLAGFDGTIRTEVRYTVGGNGGGKNGVVLFDVIHTPVLPATWRGPVREAVDDGALHFYLPIEVRLAGRYIVSGRVDDARGAPFALLNFNELLRPGPGEIDLRLFGKLLRDGAPAMPLHLRDVDGYLLKDKPGADGADRLLLPRLEGTVHVSKTYDNADFSDAEWQSEQRTRYLSEFARDVALARGRLALFDPAVPLPPAGCALPAPGLIAK